MLLRTVCLYILTAGLSLFDDVLNIITRHLQFIYKHFLKSRLKALGEYGRQLCYIAHNFLLISADYQLYKRAGTLGL